MKVAQITEHKKTWSQSASMMLAAAKEYVEALNTPLPFESIPPAPNWAVCEAAIKSAAQGITARKKSGIFTTFFEVALESGRVKCYFVSAENKELFFEIGPVAIQTQQQ